MNRNIIRILFVLSTVLLIGCFVNKNTNTILKTSICGYASCDNWYWSKSKKKFVKVPNMKDAYFWYKDSLIIYENYILDTETGADGNTKYEFSVLSYTFLDMRTKHGYDYLNFSDTAKCTISKTILPGLRYGKIWAFLGEMPYADPDSTVKQMTDTVMNSIAYQRFSMYETFKHDDGDQIVHHYVYLNCNAAPNHRMFQFDKQFSRKYGNGCPIQWETSHYKIGDLLGTGGFVFYRDSLTAAEHKVFDAWEKYAKEHPVKE